MENILKRIKKRYNKGKGFCNIIISEGAKIEGGMVVSNNKNDVGEAHIKLGGIGNYLRTELEKAGCQPQVRTTILGHTQRGGTPVAFDRILASAMGVKAFELVEANEFGQMVAYQNHELVSVPIKEAISQYNMVDKNHYLIKTARKLGISFGD